MNKLFDNLKVGDLVCDTWWRYRGCGIITKKYNKTLHIKWNSNVPEYFKIYDKPHVNQFLEKVDI